METMLKKLDVLLKNKSMGIIQTSAGERILVRKGEKIPLLQGGKLLRKIFLKRARDS